MLPKYGDIYYIYIIYVTTFLNTKFHIEITDDPYMFVHQWLMTSCVSTKLQIEIMMLPCWMWKQECKCSRHSWIAHFCSEKLNLIDAVNYIIYICYVTICSKLILSIYVVSLYCYRQLHAFPDSKVHGTNMGPTWGRHVGHMNFAIWVGPIYSQNLPRAAKCYWISVFCYWNYTFVIEIFVKFWPKFLN